MGTILVVIGSFLLGAVADHFLEARTSAAITNAIEKLGDRLVEEIRKLQ